MKESLATFLYEMACCEGADITCGQVGMLYAGIQHPLLHPPENGSNTVLPGRRMPKLDLTCCGPLSWRHLVNWNLHIFLPKSSNLVSSPVENRKDWREMKKRFRPETPGRYPEDPKTRSQVLESQDYPIILNINGPFWQLREWCGMENLCMLMLDDSDWIEEMVNFWANFVSEVMAPIQKQVKIDCIVICEDMAYKTRSMISPKMVRQIFLPVYQRWVLQIKKGGCPIVSLDSDGYVAELIPLWIEAGINCSEPMEVAAGNDIVSYRRIYGKEMAYRGGIDKRAIAKGGQVMEEEVMRVVSPLLEGGGFIPSCDHGVPPDISWPNYVEYSRLLAKLTGWL